MTTITRRSALTSLAMMAAGGGSALAQTFGRESANPSIGLVGDSGPSQQTEAGVGALIAWADKLWAVTYVSEPNAGSGTGLYEIDERLNFRMVHESNGVYANRFHHKPSQQVNIGPYMIDYRGNYRVIESLVGERLTATMPHLSDQQNKIYILTMESRLHEVDVHTLETSLLFNLNETLGVTGRPHYKGGFTSQGRVVIANNTYTEPGDDNGRLAEWDGETWTIIERKPFMEISGRWGFGNVIFAIGWDDLSAILMYRSGGQWHERRLPKGGHAYDHWWCTEWTRIREVETERFLMDCHGIFYELPSFAYHDHVWGILPICRHLRIIPDFCPYRGFLALGGNQATPVAGNFHSPQPQASIWFGKTDDLWQFGKPQGWGGVWRDTNVEAGQPSTPFLMTGFDRKVLHVTQQGATSAKIAIEVDFLGHGAWRTYSTVDVSHEGYAHHVFPAGFSAHWVRLVSDSDCEATAEFIYS